MSTRIQEKQIQLEHDAEEILKQKDTFVKFIEKRLDSYNEQRQKRTHEHAEYVRLQTELINQKQEENIRLEKQIQITQIQTQKVDELIQHVGTLLALFEREFPEMERMLLLQNQKIDWIFESLKKQDISIVSGGTTIHGDTGHVNVAETGGVASQKTS